MSDAKQWEDALAEAERLTQLTRESIESIIAKINKKENN